METKDNIDIVEFTRWITKNINLILNKKQTNLFRKMEMAFEDIKLFGKDTRLKGYYRLHQREFELNQLNWILEWKD